jgi:hypothetical protein
MPFNEALDIAADGRYSGHELNVLAPKLARSASNSAASSIEV